MIKSCISFRLRFNLLSLLLTVGLVAWIADRATIHGAQRIDQNLQRAQALMSSRLTGDHWSVEHLPSLIPSPSANRPSPSGSSRQLVSQ